MAKVKKISNLEVLTPQDNFQKLGKVKRIDTSTLLAKLLPNYRKNINGKKQEIAKSFHDFGSETLTETISVGGITVGLCVRFEHGTICSFTSGSKVTTAAVWGAIRRHWDALGGLSPSNPVGLPVTDETTAPDKVGRFNHFTEGSIYWSPKTGAHYVTGAIRGKWSRMDWERGDAGYPTTDEVTTPQPKSYGRFNHFEGGSIYWTPRLGAQWIPKDIFGHWATLGHEREEMGFPVDPASATLGISLVGGTGVKNTVFFEGGYIQRLAGGKFTHQYYDRLDFSKLTLTKAPFPIEIVYIGFRCIKESRFDQVWSAGSDEPYFFIGAFGPDGSDAHARGRKFGRYHDVDSGEARLDQSRETTRTIIRIERGADLTPIGLSVFGYEHDEGDNAVEGALGDAVVYSLRMGAAVLTEVISQGATGGAAGKVAQTIVSQYDRKFIGWASGKRDDDIDIQTRLFSTSELLTLASGRVRRRAPISTPYNAVIQLRNREEGDYTLYFRVRKG